MEPRIKKERRKKLKIIIAESLMVVSAIVAVVIMALLVSGYWINSDLEIERQGMVQITSTPVGADIQIDGESNWLFRTDASKVLKSGSHTIVLSKAGYDTWSKEINVSEGLLHRLKYPQLFWQQRTPEELLAVEPGAVTSTSPNYNKMLIIESNNTWRLVNLNSDSLPTQVLDVSEIIPTASTIQSLSWSGDSAHILTQMSVGDVAQWILVDIKNPANSINLSEEFNGAFAKMQIIDNSANNILAVKDGNLHRIDVARKQISAVLAKNVTSFDHLDGQIIFSAIDGEGRNYVALIDGDQNKNIISTKYPALVAIGEFYDEKYYAILDGSTIFVSKFASDEDTISYELGFSADSLKIKGEGAVVVATLNNSIAVIDMESSGSISEWNLDGGYHWLNDFMLYSAVDGELKVYDYDGLNSRTLAHGILNDSAVVISNNKWLYYLKENMLMREKIIE